MRRNARSFAELGTEEQAAARVTPPVELAGQRWPSVEPTLGEAQPRSFAELGEAAAAAEPKKPNLLARARSWLAASVDEEELDGPEDRIAVDPTHDDVRQCLALVPEAFAKHPSAEAWARQALIVQRGNVEYAAKKLTKLAAFRDRYGWAYRIDVDDRVAKALRSDMHWVLPGTDRRGRRGLQRARVTHVEGPRSVTEVAVLVTGTDHAGRGDGAPRRRRRGGLLGLLAVDAPEAVRRGRAARLGHGRRLPLPPAHDLCGEPADAVVAGSVVYPRVFIKEAEGPAPRERVAVEARGL